MEPPVTLITGTSRGLGHDLARHYLGRGHRVVGCSRQPAPWSADGYRHFEVDVAEEGQVREMFSAIRKEFGRLDHLVNNAGIAAMNHALTTPNSTVDRVLRTNVGGTFACCREGAKLMRKRRFGRIVNLTTVAVPLRLEGESIYAASKAAVETLTAILAREFAPFGITVNAVGPMPIETDLIRGVPAEKIEALLARHAIPRRGEPSDVANVADFFLSERSALVTGQTLYLGGP
ncbi:MAG: SDR family oxidoreductase [Gemmatimonadales bacterium]|nr:MAG: SDR family oxidoreductase [Gemmatimonadales bacterium]